MALLQPDHGDPGEDRVSAGAVGGPEAQLERRLIRDGSQVVARGSLICPSCDLPLPANPPRSAIAYLTCGWCGHSDRAREFLRTDATGGPPASGAQLVARLSN